MTAVAVSGEAPRTQPDAETTGTAPGADKREKAELRPSHEALPPEKRPVRVILPSPYSDRR
jgi:hypothetical protein